MRQPSLGPLFRHYSSISSIPSSIIYPSGLTQISHRLFKCDQVCEKLTDQAQPQIAISDYLHERLRSLL
jgi:hypothetical protein